MHVASLIALIFVVASILPIFRIGTTTPHRGSINARSVLPSRTLRSAVVENGTPLVVLPLPTYQEATNLAFAPDGTAYFMNGSNEVDRVAPDGTYSKISVPGAYSFEHGFGTIIYAHGNLWMSSSHGIVKVAPDGSRRRVYQLIGTSYDPTLGPDGAIYATVTVVGKTPASMLYRIDASGTLTGIALPVSLGGLTANSDGDLYSGYADIATGTKTGIARVHPNLAIDLIPNDPTLYLASSKGNVYFEDYYYVPTLGTSIYELARLDRNGIITKIPLPPIKSETSPIVESLSVDKGGNLWMVISSNFDGEAALYQYNVYTGHFTNVILPDSHFFSFYGDIVTVGPDDNIWWVWSHGAALALVAYVRNVQTLEPSNLILSSGTPAQFAILESHENGPWTARSLDPSVAVVSPAVSSTGAFSVMSSGVGMTSIAVADR